MSQHTIANRYAKAMYEFAKEQRIVDDVLSDVTDILQMLDASLELQQLIQLPTMTTARKEVVLTAVLNKAKLSKHTIQFIQLVTRKGRAGLLRMICEAVVQIHKTAQNILEADVLTASELDKKQLKSIRAYLEKRFNKTIELNVNIDPELIGGFQIRVNHQLIDMSVRAQMDQLKQALIAG